MGGPPALREGRWCHQPVGAVRPVAVVVLAVVLDHHLGLSEAVEDLDREQLVADAAVKALHERVLPWRARFDERRPGPGEPTPVPKRVRGHLRTVVTPDELRTAALLGDDPVQYFHDLVAIDAALGFHRQRLAGELVHDVEQLDRTAVFGDVPLEIKGPHMIGTLGAQPVAWHRGIPTSLAFAALGRHPQPLLPPQPLGALAVDRPALLEQILMGTTVTPPRPTTRERPKRHSQCRVILSQSQLMTLGRSVLTGKPARPTLREPEPVLQRKNGMAPPGRAQKFPG
jgi:hypothetical protein